MFNIFRSLAIKSQLLHRAAFGLAFIFLIISSAQVNATCTVNGISYRTNSDTSGTYITLSNLTSRRSAWNNSTDLVTTCDVSQFTSLYEAFYYNSAFNQDLSAWDTSSVTDMYGMFWNATSLTSVSLPQTGAVTNMYAMFWNATSLTSVSLPQTGAVTDMSFLLGRTYSLNTVTLPRTGAVTNMHCMFCFATGLTSVSLPQKGAVMTMTYMFYGATSFAQDIRSWDVDNVSNFYAMFYGATAMIAAFLAPQTGT